MIFLGERPSLWSEEEREAFIRYVAAEPLKAIRRRQTLAELQLLQWAPKCAEPLRREGTEDLQMIQRLLTEAVLRREFGACDSAGQVAEQPGEE